ncbi:MAG: universal stress protein [Halofilum sp. (in: g-proteobacteria)]
MLEHILIATDGSENARRAEALGSGIASCFGARVLLAHVQVEEPSDSDVRGMTEVWQQVGPQPFGVLHMDDIVQHVGSTPGREHVDTREKALQEIGNEVLENARQKAQEAGVEKVETRLLHGDPAKAIIDVADLQGVDLVVMGSRGAGRVEGVLLGSVSQKVSSGVTASCLTVR